MKPYAEMSKVELALLGALEFIGRIGTGNPPSGFDRITQLAKRRRFIGQ